MTTQPELCRAIQTRAADRVGTFWARRFEIGEFALAIAPFKRMFQQRRAVAIALFGGVHSNHRQIPMRLGRMELSICSMKAKISCWFSCGIVR